MCNCGGSGASAYELNASYDIKALKDLIADLDERVAVLEAERES